MGDPAYLEVVDAHKSDINCCHVSPKGIIATCGGDRLVQLWKVKENTIVQLDISPLKGHNYGVNYVRFSPYGTIIASASTDGTVILWDVRTGSVLSTFFSGTGYSFRVCQFSPDSALIAAGGDDDKVYIWRIADKELLRTISSHEATVFSLTFSPDSSVLVSSDSSGRLFVWSTQPGHHTLLTDINEAHDLGVTSMDFCMDFSKSALWTEYTLATCGNDGDLKLWTILTGSKNSLELKKRTFAHENCAMFVTFGSKGKLLATSGGDKTIKLWTPELQLLTVFENHPRYVTSCSIFGNLGLVAATSNRTLRIHKLPSSIYSSSGALTDNVSSDLGHLGDFEATRESKFQFSLNASKSRVEFLTKIVPPINSDISSCDIFNNILAISCGEPVIYLWSLNGADTGGWRQMEQSPLKGHTYTVYSLHFGNSGDLTSGSLDGEVIIWNVYSGEIIRRLLHPERIGFRTVRMSAGGKVVAAGGDDDTCLVWDQKNSARHCVLREHDNTVFALDTSERFIVTACSGERIKVWDLATVFSNPNSVFSVEEAHDLGVTCCAFQPKQQVDDEDDTNVILATGGTDSIIKLWRLNEEGKLSFHLKLEDHGGSIMCLRYSMDGALLGSSSGDRTARIWDSATYKCIYVIDQHARYVTCCAFSPDSQLFVTSCENYINVWKLNFGAKDDMTTFKDDITAYQALNIKDWSSVEVRAWLNSLGIQDLDGRFSKLTGSSLLILNKDELDQFGFNDVDSSKILENIQHCRHGLDTRMSESQDIPCEFLCPITQELMEHPVLLSDGFIYEQMAIKEWLLTRRKTSPMTNLEIEDDILKPCPELERQIQLYLQTQT